MTTKYRYRPENRLFRAPLLVLQMGVEVVHGYDSQHEGETYIVWRDVTLEDISIAEVLTNDN